MGDIVLTTPIVRNIKNHYKDAEIDFLAGSQFIEIIKYNPYITKIIEYDKSLNLREILKYKDDLIKHNNNKKYDIVIDLQNNLRSRIFRFGLGRKVFSIKKNRIYKLCLVHCKRKISTKFSHIVQNYKKSYKALNITDDEFGLELWLPEDLSDNNYIHDRDSKGKPTLKIGIAPGAFHFTKRYPIEKYIELIKKLKDSFNCQIEMIGGKADEQICNQIYSSCSSFIESVYISTSISNSARIINSFDLLITNDTGVMHIAAARKVPIVAIFGSTSTDFGFTPYKVKYEVVEQDVSCRPCSHIGRKKCPKKHFNCMNQINTDDIILAVKSMIQT